MLNTHYYSHYNKDYDKKPERNDCLEAIKNLEEQI
jgi:hypothetical protein